MQFYGSMTKVHKHDHTWESTVAVEPRYCFLEGRLLLQLIEMLMCTYSVNLKKYFMPKCIIMKMVIVYCAIN